MDYTAKNVQAATICRHLATDLLSTSKYRLHGFRQLVDDKSVASCQNLLSTGLLQVVLTSCNKSANDQLPQTLF